MTIAEWRAVFARLRDIVNEMPDTDTPLTWLYRRLQREAEQGWPPEGVRE